MNTRFLDPRTPFTFEDLDLTVDDFNLAMSEMIDSGLITFFMKDDELYYQLTDIGYAVGQHLFTDSKMLN